jgi:hypothetical protein
MRSILDEELMHPRSSFNYKVSSQQSFSGDIRLQEALSTHTKGTGLYAKIGNVTLELVSQFQPSRSDLVAIQVSGYLLNKEDKPLTTEERKQLHEHKFS